MNIKKYIKSKLEQKILNMTAHSKIPANFNYCISDFMIDSLHQTLISTQCIFPVSIITYEIGFWMPDNTENQLYLLRRKDSESKFDMNNFSTFHMRHGGSASQPSDHISFNIIEVREHTLNELLNEIPS